MATKTTIAQLSLSTLPPLYWDDLPEWRIDSENFRDTEYELFSRLNGKIQGRRIEIGIFTGQDLVFGEVYDENAAPQETTKYVHNASYIEGHLGFTFTDFSGATVVKGLRYSSRELADDLPAEQRIGVLARDAVPEGEFRRQAAASLTIVVSRPLKIKRPIWGLVGFERRPSGFITTIQPEAVGGQGDPEQRRWSFVGRVPRGLRIHPVSGLITTEPDIFSGPQPNVDELSRPQVNVKIRVSNPFGEVDEAVFPIIQWLDPIQARDPSDIPRYTRPSFGNTINISISELFDNVHFASANVRFNPPRFPNQRKHEFKHGPGYGSLSLFLPNQLNIPEGQDGVKVDITVGDATGTSVVKTIEIVD